MSYFVILAHRQGKQRAIELFQQGWCAADVAASLGVSLRSVQRWFSEFREKSGLTSSSANEESFVPPVEIEDLNSNLQESNFVNEKPKKLFTSEPQPEDFDLIKLIQDNCRRVCVDNTAEIDEYFGQKYLDFSERLGYYHFMAHLYTRVKIHELLNLELSKSDLNLRAIEKLSLALCRHIQGEREAVNLNNDILDINRAVARLWGAGFGITRVPGEE